MTWTVQEGAAGGAVSSTGTYTAPSTPGTYHVVATSVADGTRQDVAAVTVATAASGWLTVVGNRIETPDGLPWRGRGANLHDTRGCGACTYNSPSVAEVNRRIDELVDNWHANFIRLDLESYAAANGQVNWAGILLDAGYLADVQAIVAHAVAKPGVYVLISLWVDPSFTSLGWPTAATNQQWAKLAEVFRDEPRVLYGIVNEPQANYDGAQDAQVWSAMNAAVQAIRDVETAAGTPHHVITVQGTRSWSRVLDYYLTHPITAGGGVNIAYETHVYDGANQFAARFETPSLTVPVIIGEFGPVSGSMTESDCATLMASAEAHGVPYLAWTFHMRCPPNLLVDNSGGSCGVGMTLAPTSWGTLLKNRLATPW
ncbi:MAG TPA: cellulase family glycosylhydrolase [Anaeromyxobacteraceae bacterium]|nr:cellulase family glycosylhydrolase [Anaeromyxobacteraceae bacterium]